jgi:hypothetical protein
MVRTQISLSKRDYDSAKAEAARIGVSLAEFFRRALHATLPNGSKKPWMRHAGMVQSGDRNASQSIDDVVYGEKP